MLALRVWIYILYNVYPFPAKVKEPANVPVTLPAYMALAKDLMAGG
jgi:uncharacterized protein YhhL (DUF1145 family)